MSQPIIQIQHLNKTFGTGPTAVHALEDINLEIETGEIFGIIGLSGAGKSTLVRCMNLLERPTTGSVLVGGKDLTKLRDKQLRQARQDISMIFQSFNLLMQRTALDNICFPLELIGTKRARRGEPGTAGHWAWARPGLPPSSPAARSSRWPSPPGWPQPQGPACDGATAAPGPHHHPVHPGAAEGSNEPWASQWWSSPTR